MTPTPTPSSARSRGQLPRLHAVTDDAVLARHDFSKRAASLAQSGSVAIHVRGRGLTGQQLITMAAAVQSAASSSSSKCFVNDRVDVARIIGADGVHLPADGLPTQAVRSVIGPDFWIGRSTHSSTEARAALDQGADYVFLGPIWPTASHPDRPAIGPEAITAVGESRVIAIGGVTPARIALCLAAGAYGVAVISSLWPVTDPGAAAREMLVLLNR